MLQSLLYPLRPTPLLMIFSASILIWAALFGDIFVFLVLLNNIILPLMLVTAAKYLFLALEKTAQGHRDPPFLSHTLWRVFEEWRPYQFLMVALVVFTLSRWLRSRELENTAHFVVVAALLFMPAFVGLLGLKEGLARALNPIILVRFIRRMGPAYLGILGMLYLSYALISWFYKSGPGLYAAVLFIGYILVLMFHLLGRVIYLRREALDYLPDHSPERLAAAREAALIDARKKHMDRIFKLRESERALPILLACVETEEDKLAAHVWYHDQLMRWDQKWLALRHAPFYIRAMRDAGDVRSAERIERVCRDIHPDFKAD